MDPRCERGPAIRILSILKKNPIKTPEMCFTYPEGVRVTPHCIINPPVKVAFNKITKQQRYKQKKILTAK